MERHYREIPFSVLNDEMRYSCILNCERSQRAFYSFRKECGYRDYSPKPEDMMRVEYSDPTCSEIRSIEPCPWFARDNRHRYSPMRMSPADMMPDPYGRGGVPRSEPSNPAPKSKPKADRLLLLCPV